MCLISSNYSAISSIVGDSTSEFKTVGFPRWQFESSIDKAVKIEPHNWNDCVNDVRPATDNETTRYLIQNKEFRENKDRNDFLLFALNYTNKNNLLMTETVEKELDL